MAVESQQCPRCGAPLPPGASLGFISCIYCGSRLRIVNGPAGQRVDVLDEGGRDAQILARQAAINHLQRRLPDLYQQRDALVRECRWAVADAVPATAGATARMVVGLALLAVCVPAALFALWVPGLVVPSPAIDGASSTSGACCVLPSLLLAAIGVAMWRQAAQVRAKAQEGGEDAARQVQERYWPMIAAAEEEIRSAEARIAELRAGMDRLVKDL